MMSTKELTSNIHREDLKRICNDPYVSDFKTIDIDIDDSMLNHLVTVAGIRIKDAVMPCSLDIWNEKVDSIQDVPDLQRLIGECLVNDELVEAIIAGVTIAESANTREPYYEP